MLNFLKLHLLKFVAAAALLAGVATGSFVTKLSYSGKLKRLETLEIEKSFFDMIKTNQAEYISQLTSLLKETESTNKKLVESKLNAVKTNVLNSDFSQCVISDELLDSLDAVGK